MKKLIIIALILSPVILFAKSNDSINIEIHSGVKDVEFQDYLSFRGVGYFNIILSGKNLIGKRFYIIAKEYRDSMKVNVDTLVDITKTPLQYLPLDTLRFSVITEKLMDDSLKISFNFKNLFGISKLFKVNNTDRYATQSLTKNTKFIPINESQPILVYTLPYVSKQGYLMYCLLHSEGIPPSKWGVTYNIPHYIVFEIVVF